MKRPEELNIRKAAWLSIGADVLQVVLVCGAAVWLFFNRLDGSPMLRLLVLAGALFVAIGCIADIRSVISQGKILSQIDDMLHTMEAQEQLNITLRAQRHDFLNHLQVVYSLIEMEDYEEANAYIEKLYGDITSLSRVMKTASPAINALLQVKDAACGKAGIAMKLNITSSWKDLPIEGWEMCKVLSNLIDNAMDALKGCEAPELSVELTEDLHSFRFSVGDNGPMVPDQLRQSIFKPGVTTKSDGHGMGLHIVRETLKNAGGDIVLDSTDEQTVFSGWIPKEKTEAVSVSLSTHPEEKTAASVIDDPELRGRVYL